MNSGKILRFKTDTKHRKDWFTGISFSHPAKMSLPLQLWIIENYTKGASDLTITPEMLYNMDKEIRWCNCADSNL